MAGLGLTERDDELRFELASGGDGLEEVSKHFVARRDLEFTIGGAAIAIAGGEKLRMSSSIKYADESALRSRIEADGATWNRPGRARTESSSSPPPRRAEPGLRLPVFRSPAKCRLCL